MVVEDTIAASTVLKLSNAATSNKLLHKLALFSYVCCCLLLFVVVVVVVAVAVVVVVAVVAVVVVVIVVVCCPWSIAVHYHKQST